MTLEAILSTAMQVLSYDQITGVFIRIKRSGPSAIVGSEAGHVNSKGYRIIKVCGRGVKAHRLAWAWVHGVWPSCEIDHRNGMKSDNRITNLRLATTSENQRNRGALRNNTTGFKGVYWHSESRKWRSMITVDGKTISLGLFDCPKKAHSAYCKAASRYHGQFANTGDQP